MQKEQLRIIKNYLHQFDVKYLDLQTELIDHFASAVSHIQQQHPQLTFQEALMRAHQKFGGKAGFRKYLLAAENRVEKKVLKTLGLLSLRLFSWPLVLKVIIAVGLAWLFTAYVNNPYAIFGLLLSLLIGQALYLHWRWRKTQYFLVKRALNSLALYLYLFIYLPFSNLVLFSSASFNTYWALSSLLLLFFTVVQGLPAALQQLASEEYPAKPTPIS
jgi:hypothetical protein